MKIPSFKKKKIKKISPAELSLKNNGETFLIEKLNVKIPLVRKTPGEDENEGENARGVAKRGRI